MVVGRIGRPHGVRGEVTVDVRTDDPDLRFAPGTALRTEPAERGPLTVVGKRWHSGTLLLRIAGVDGIELADREAADAYRNTLLVVEVADLPELEDPDSFYDHQLVGLDVQLTDGTVVGTVTGVRHEGTELLVVRRPGVSELLVPFVSAIVPTVDLAAGHVVLTPPEGLLEL
ncbi:16S rRNA processing protein RimM [Modestobacter sp. Leaf380]|nr:16S rRNA processing protein RimM [Modestobacter sp. Leaf380]